MQTAIQFTTFNNLSIFWSLSVISLMYKGSGQEKLVARGKRLDLKENCWFRTKLVDKWRMCAIVNLVLVLFFENIKGLINL